MKSRFALAILALVLFSGCGKPGRSEAVATLEGNVTIHGKPLPADVDADSSLTFYPAVRGEAPPVQAKLVNGHYKAEKVPQGQVLVMFHIMRATGKMLKTSPNDIHPTPERIDLVPEAKRAGVRIEVHGGDKTGENFDL